MSEILKVLNRKVELKSEVVEFRIDVKKLESETQKDFSASIKAAEKQIRNAINILEASTKAITKAQKEHSSEYGKMRVQAKNLGIDLEKTSVGKDWLKVGSYLNKLSQASVSNSTKLASFKL